jgi:hypothetical protein
MPKDHTHYCSGGGQAGGRMTHAWKHAPGTMPTPCAAKDGWLTCPVHDDTPSYHEGPEENNDNLREVGVSA